MRLIDADALKQHYAWWGETESGAERKRLFDEIIDQQPTVGKWISVAERLPENIANRVLVLCDGSAGLFFGHLEPTGWINLETDKPFAFTVTHWMPLPPIPA